jgi:NAD(P)H-nitrite reductase large subunit
MNIVIIGNGITGITCARNIRKLDSRASITVISAESEHFFSRTALMYIYMGHMKFEHTKPYEDWFWNKNRINLIRAFVKTLNTKEKVILFDNGESIAYDKLIIASGSIPNKFGWPGENLNGVQGLYSIQDLELMERNTKNISSAVIIGGGLIGIEMAEMLHSRKIQVKMLVRENLYWGNILPREEAQLIGKHISGHGIDLQFNTQLKEIISDDQNHVTGVLTNTGEKFECQFVGLTAGVKPNIGFLEKNELETDKGILINEYFETSVPIFMQQVIVHSFAVQSQENPPLSNYGTPEKCRQKHWQKLFVEINLLTIVGSGLIQPNFLTWNIKHTGRFCLKSTISRKVFTGNTQMANMPSGQITAVKMKAY